MISRGTKNTSYGLLSDTYSHFSVLEDIIFLVLHARNIAHSHLAFKGVVLNLFDSIVQYLKWPWLLQLLLK